MKKSIALFVSLVTSALMTPTAFASSNSMKPLNVHVDTTLPNLPPLQQVQVPTFADGLAQLHDNFASDQSKYEVTIQGSGQSFLFQHGGNESASQIFSGLTQELPQMSKPSTPSLPNVQSGFDAQKQQNSQSFAQSLTTDPFKEVPLSSIAPGIPDTSNWSAQTLDAAQNFIAQNVPTSLAPTGHQFLTATPPAGWSQQFATGAAPFTEDSVFANMKSPNGWGFGIMHQVPKLLNAALDVTTLGTIQINDSNIGGGIFDAPKFGQGWHNPYPKGPAQAGKPAVPTPNPNNDPFSQQGNNLFANH